MLEDTELDDFTLELVTELTTELELDFTLELVTELITELELDFTLELATELITELELDFTLELEDDTGQPATTPKGAGWVAQVEGAIQLLPFS